MASDAPLRSARLPSNQQVAELLEAEFNRAGYDVEEVLVDASARPPRIVVIADGDQPPNLDSIAALSRSASELLDGLDDAEPYVLEVTSPGVDRPLTAPRHFRRARGRKAELVLADGERLTARLGPLTGEVVRLVIPGARHGAYATRDVDLADITEAVVQVEFSTPNRREMELAGGVGSDGEQNPQPGEEARS